MKQQACMTSIFIIEQLEDVFGSHSAIKTKLEYSQIQKMLDFSSDSNTFYRDNSNATQNVNLLTEKEKYSIKFYLIVSYKSVKWVEKVFCLK